MSEGERPPRQVRGRLPQPTSPHISETVTWSGCLPGCTGAARAGGAEEGDDWMGEPDGRRVA